MWVWTLKLLFRAPRCLNSVRSPFCKATLRDKALTPALCSERTNERTNERTRVNRFLQCCALTINALSSPLQAKKPRKKIGRLARGQSSVLPPYSALRTYPPCKYNVKVHMPCLLTFELVWSTFTQHANNRSSDRIDCIGCSIFAICRQLNSNAT